jgi:hypothetical protein
MLHTPRSTHPFCEPLSLPVILRRTGRRASCVSGSSRLLCAKRTGSSSRNSGLLPRQSRRGGQLLACFMRHASDRASHDIPCLCPAVVRCRLLIWLTFVIMSHKPGDTHRRLSARYPQDVRPRQLQSTCQPDGVYAHSSPRRSRASSSAADRASVGACCAGDFRV